MNFGRMLIDALEQTRPRAAHPCPRWEIGRPLASFSRLYPLAFHVAPLHALKGIWARRALLSKGDAGRARPTTERIDRALGMDGFVHFYLAKSPERVFELPILMAQLRPSTRPPFPHVVLELPTAALSDSESVICNWNLAVSRPRTAEVKGGNWARGTNPERIAAVWRSLRASNPPCTKARGYFNDPYLVPTLLGRQICNDLALLRRAPRGMPELLLRAPVHLSRCSRLLVFSPRDFTAVQLLGELLLPGADYQYPGYAGDLVPAETRRKIEGYFASRGDTKPPDFNFDAVRPVA